MKETFGDRIRRLRESKKFKQEQVALALRVNRKAISHYENNLREPSFEILIKMAELYRVSTDYLLGMENTCIINASGLSEKEFSLLSELVADIIVSTFRKSYTKTLQTLKSMDYSRYLVTFFSVTVALNVTVATEATSPANISGD